MRDNWRHFVIVFILAVITHVTLLSCIHLWQGRIDSFAFQSLDAQEYYQIARNIVDHGICSQSVNEPFIPDTWRTPGYPLFLAGCMKLVGAAPWALIVVQQILCVINTLLFLLVVRSYMSTTRSLIAVGCFVLEPYHLYYSLWLMATTFFVTMLLLVWLSWQRAERTKRVWWYLCSGVLCGLLILIRPIGIMVPILLAMYCLMGIVLARRGRGLCMGRWTWSMLIGFSLATVGTLSPWIGRNQRVANHMALSDQSGVVMAYFKATEVVLWGQGRSADRFMETSLDPMRSEYPHEVWDEIDAELRRKLVYLPASQRKTLRWENLAQGNKTEVDSFLISNHLLRIGVSYMLASPFSTMACLATRCGCILTFPLNLAIKPAVGVEVSRGRQLVQSLPYVILTFFGLWSLVRYRNEWRDWYAPMLLLAALLVMSTPQFDPRFRVPMVPMMLVLALYKPSAAEERD